jgi:hypothetical protein
MQLPRFIGVVDLAVATVVAVAIFLPAREMYAAAAQKGSDTDRFELALAEARSIAHPEDGNAVSEVSRRLDEAGFKDWAIESAVHGSAAAAKSPTAWRALLAASVAYVDRLDAVPALEYANRALASCQATAQSCPSWEEIRMQLYQQHLDAGVKSGIDPHKDPRGFRRAAEAALRTIHIKTNDQNRAPVPAPPAPPVQP